MNARAVNPDCVRRVVRAAGFTLLEVLITIAMIGMIAALVAPNLGAFVPTAALDGESTQLVRWLDWTRSTARIEGKRMELELDLDKRRWRAVFPPEAKLTSDQEAWTLDIQPLEWHELGDGVVLAGAGDALHGMVRKGPYRIVFDQYGFTADQLFVFKLTEDPKLVWSVVLQGITGRCRVEKNEDGQEHRMLEIREGAF